MTTRHFATVSIRLLGITAIVVGVVLAGSSGIVQALGTASITSTSTSDLQLHDSYYVISNVEYLGLVPGIVSAITGVLLVIISRALGAWLSRGTESES